MRQGAGRVQEVDVAGIRCSCSGLGCWACLLFPFRVYGVFDLVLCFFVYSRC